MVLESSMFKYQNVFNSRLGQVHGSYAKLYVDSEAKRKYYKPRSYMLRTNILPYMLRTKIEQERERLQEEQTISPVEFYKTSVQL